MVNLINSWVKQITIAVVLSTIIEMLLPEGSAKKYVRTVIGAYIVFIIISPVITKITGKKISLSEYKIPQTKEYEVSTIDTNAQIKRTYINKIKQDIIEKIENIGYTAQKVEVEIEDEEYTNITKIVIEAIKKKEESNTVKPIEITIKNEKKEILTEQEEEEIKKLLKNSYGVKEENIIVN